ncbi:14546_t:CDS:2 [Funneliformis geosporum]|uniref:7932_t:CDS:1 n=1 Tax=Funneliformis geosporum TaxID=1117311 RepID=A0A9W4SY85_9GLOM|nr:7932_t:CDS:2 [Funneliformis geosporum]CAI2186083.1 14546_t:CDS:2 [Funneliformis geosporum]
MTDNQIFLEFENYDFENDVTFQSGLPSILNSYQGKPKEEINILKEKAKWFYYSKVIQEFDYNDYLVWKTNLNKSASSHLEGNQSNIKSSSVVLSTDSQEISTKDERPEQATTDNPQYPQSFQQVVEMLATGQQIPGIKQIPNELNKGTPSNPTFKPRPKPWEKKHMNNESK